MTPGGEKPQGLRPTIGVFGGTFNPIHLGHLRAAEECAEQLDLEQVLFVPSADPPHKSGRNASIAPARERCGWVEAAVADNPRFAVDRLELERSGPSFAVDTLGVLGERLAPMKPVFLIGDEAFLEIGTWRQPERVISLAHFAVWRRPGAHPAHGLALEPADGPTGEPAGELADWLPEKLACEVELEAGGRVARHRSAGTWIRSLEICGLEVSATEIRERLRSGRSTRYLIPEAARAAVEQSGSYEKQEAS